MAKKVVLNKAELEAIYKTRNLEDTAMLMGVSIVTLRKCMRELGVQSHSFAWSPKTAIDENTLIELYKNYSVPEIAEVVKMDMKTVYTRMREYGIKLRKHGPVKVFDPSRDELHDLYFNKHYTMLEIAEHYGVGETVVFKRLREHKLILPKRVAREMREDAEMVRAERDSLGMRVWRSAVLKKADHKCQKCGIAHRHVCDCCGQKVVIHAHHIKPFSLFPSLRLDVSNGIALCVMCHWKEHREQNRAGH